ncbi:hypothetical protein D3C83_278720 [compost metagenome]
MVRAMVAELHLDGPGAAREPQELVAEADSEGRKLRGKQRLDGADCVVARLGIAGAIGEKHAVGF